MTPLLFSSCFDNEEGSDAEDDAAIRWADAYFNYDLRTAQRYVTPESRTWLSFLASNMTEADVEILRQQDESATIQLTSCKQVNDSTWMASLSVRNFMIIDSIGQTGHIVSEAEFTVPIVKRNKRTFVKMNGLPRQGK
jgi:hypothetical protein